MAFAGRGNGGSYFYFFTDSRFVSLSLCFQFFFVVVVLVVVASNTAKKEKKEGGGAKATSMPSRMSK